MQGPDLRRANVNIPPATRAATTVNGAAYDLVTPGRTFSAIFAVGTIGGSNVHVNPTVQSSDDGSTWATLSRDPPVDLNTGATCFTITFRNLFRYVRGRIQITGGGSVSVPSICLVVPHD